MSDLSSQISQILGNPEMVEQIKNLSGLFGQSADSVSSSAEKSQQSQPSVPAQTSSPLDLLGSDGLQTAMRFMPILNELRQEDDTTRLLRAIKPFLSPERQEKLEEAIKLLRIIRILPFLRNQGLMNLF